MNEIERRILRGTQFAKGYFYQCFSFWLKPEDFSVVLLREKKKTEAKG